MAIAISVFESWERFLFIPTGIILSTLAYFYFVMKLPTNHMQTNEKNFNLSLNWCGKNAIGNRQQCLCIIANTLTWGIRQSKFCDCRNKSNKTKRVSEINNNNRPIIFSNESGCVSLCDSWQTSGRSIFLHREPACVVCCVSNILLRIYRRSFL